ncbi:hypothetical protein PENANT_c258G11388 [Penicillium antarcticum]|uniref:Uncharacterized protein n=1 Tax=Penicillium antarcticum TaxID=416450 RepID=A0A1V6P0Q7_9EURO|nr:hypothetical protein PENANT_c258G11388 [Penicillium antarcticum]
MVKSWIRRARNTANWWS